MAGFPNDSITDWPSWPEKPRPDFAAAHRDRTAQNRRWPGKPAWPRSALSAAFLPGQASVWWRRWCSPSTVRRLPWKRRVRVPRPPLP